MMERLTTEKPPTITELEFHSLAEFFPLMTEDELAELAADIKKNGLLEPITLYQNRIIDGRNRYRACRKAGVEITQTDTYNGSDPAAFVASRNLHRRHLTREQRNELLAKLLKANPERSDRATAKLAGASDKTATSVRKGLEARSEIPHVEQRSDSKGRKQPARKRSGDRPKHILARETTKKTEPVAAAPPISEPPKAGPISEATRAATEGRSRPLLTGVVKDSAASGFANALHTGSEGDLARVLEDLHRVLKDEKKKIASVPREQRIAVARGVLDALGVMIEDLKPIPSRLQPTEAVEEEAAQAPTGASG